MYPRYGICSTTLPAICSLDTVSGSMVLLASPLVRKYFLANTMRCVTRIFPNLYVMMSLSLYLDCLMTSTALPIGITGSMDPDMTDNSLIGNCGLILFITVKEAMVEANNKMVIETMVYVFCKCCFIFLFKA